MSEAIRRPIPEAPTRRIVVDTDTGIDDAMALLYLAGRPDAEIVAITSVYGNTTVDRAVANIGRVLELTGLTDTLVARGAAGPIRGDASIAHHVHGADGLGDIFDGDIPPQNVSPLSSAEMLVELGRSRPGELDLLAVGPLTNLGLALEIEPDLFTFYRSVVVMGGSGPFPPLGSVHMIDANVQNDPEAARRVFSAPRNRLVSVGVDVTVGAVIDEAMVDQLRDSGTPAGTFSARLLESYMDFYRLAWGRRVSPAHDGLAAGLLLDTSWITGSRTGPVAITDDGFAVRARLMETADGGPVAWPIDPAPDTVVVTEVDYRGFLEDFVSVLTEG